MPPAHRIARTLAANGWRVAPLAWTVAEKASPWPAHPVAEIADGVVMPVVPGDWISANVYRGFYERAERRVLARLVDRGGTAVDIGANRGLYTGIMSALVGPAGRVVAFEPNPRCAGALEDLVRSARLDNVVVYRVAVAAADGTAALQDVADGHSGLATLRPMPEHVGPRVDVPTVRLDAVPELAEGDIAVAKLDVEGFEAEALAGASGLIEERRLAALLLEVSPQLGSVDFLDRLLSDLAGAYEGFAVCERGSVRRRTCLQPVPPGAAAQDGSQYNMLLVRGDRRRRVEDLVLPAPA